jgi:D-aminoacyl-tRNA deacylase
MRVLVQRVSRASVTSGGRLLGSVGRGLLVFAGFTHTDGSDAIRWMCEKLLKLRIFEDGEGKMNLSVADVGGGVLLVPQFTLYADARRGNRPGFDEAARPDRALPLFAEMVTTLRGMGPVPVATGEFGAEMQVELVNDGPVTLFLEK